MQNSENNPSKKELYNTYKTLYFNEQENKEKLTVRIQISFAILLVGYSVSSYMLRMLDYESSILFIICFLTFLFLAVAISTCSAYQLVRAFWGNTFAELPTPKHFDEYIEGLRSFNKKAEDYYGKEDAVEHLQDVDSETFAFLYDEYKKCAAHNMVLNAERSGRIHKAIKFILIAIVPFFISSLIFIICDLDVSSPRKETLIYNRTLERELITLNNNISFMSKRDYILSSLDSLSSEIKKMDERYYALDRAIKEMEMRMADPQNAPKNTKPPEIPQRPKTRYVTEDYTPPKTTLEDKKNG